ncbi:sensitivity to red-light reduced protein [Mortierella alpina]|nr:sensitivity to red-light reduced protein [Mortierella alpina]
MASFNESAEAAGACVADTAAEEPFTFVSRKKKTGPRQATAAPPVPLTSLRNAKQETTEHNLPGWTIRKPAKVKKNSQRARMMGSRGPEHEPRTLEWGQSMMEDRVMSLKESRFYEAFRGTISIFDPAMTEYDQRLVEKLGMSVLKANDQAKQVVEARTLLYMPHCPKGLYSHVLETNWTREQLDRLVILGNRFTMYDERQYVKQAPFILPALSIAEVHILPAIKFEDNTIFNDLAIHSFPSHHTVPDVDVQGREQDPEMV